MAYDLTTLQTLQKILECLERIEERLDAQYMMGKVDARGVVIGVDGEAAADYRRLTIWSDGHVRDEDAIEVAAAQQRFQRRMRG